MRPATPTDLQQSGACTWVGVGNYLQYLVNFYLKSVFNFMHKFCWLRCYLMCWFQKYSFLVQIKNHRNLTLPSLTLPNLTFSFSFASQLTIISVISASNNIIINKIYAWNGTRTLSTKISDILTNLSLSECFLSCVKTMVMITVNINSEKFGICSHSRLYGLYSLGRYGRYNSRYSYSRRLWSCQMNALGFSFEGSRDFPQVP